MAGSDRREIILQPRDERLLREAALIRVIDREMAKAAAGFHSTTRANARLLALVNAGLLRRFFQGTEAGGRKALYTLSPKSARLIGVQYQGLRFGKDELIVTNFFIAHQIALNEVYCAMKFGEVSIPGVQFVRWLAFAEPLSRAIPLVPDGYGEFATPQGSLAAFLEVDLGHEGAGVWKKKVTNYLRYATSGSFEERFQQSRFRILVVANTGARLHAIRKVVRGLTDKIFWFSTFGAIRARGPWAAVWFRPADDTLRSLI
jgi:hypothetical protein